MEFTCDVGPSSLLLKFVTVQGAYRPWWSSLKIVFFGVGRAPRDITVNQTVVSDWRFNPTEQTVTLTLLAPQPDEEVLMNQ